MEVRDDYASEMETLRRNFQSLVHLNRTLIARNKLLKAKIDNVHCMYEGRLIEAEKELSGLRNLNEHLNKELAKVGKSTKLRVVSKEYVEVVNESEGSARTSTALQGETSRSVLQAQVEPKSQRTEEERYSDVFFEDEAEGSDDSDVHMHIKTMPEDEAEQSNYSEEAQEESQVESREEDEVQSSREEEEQSSREEVDEGSNDSESIDDSFGGMSEDSIN